MAFQFSSKRALSVNIEKLLSPIVQDPVKVSIAHHQSLVMIMLQNYKTFSLGFLLSHLALGVLFLVCICFKTKFVTSLLSPRIRGFLFTSRLLRASMTVQALGSGIILPLQKGLSQVSEKGFAMSITLGSYFSCSLAQTSLQQHVVIHKENT